MALLVASIYLFFCCVSNVMSTNLTCNDSVPVLSYHIHGLYHVNNAYETNASLTLYKNIKSHWFPNIPLCTPPVQDVLLIYDRIGPPNSNMNPCDLGIAPPGGPFDATNWALHISLNMIGELIPWIIEYYPSPNVSTVIHPNSGCMRKDHCSAVLWLGPPMKVNCIAMTCNNAGCDGIMGDNFPYACANNTHGECYY
eukprot:316941_1